MKDEIKYQVNLSPIDYPPEADLVLASIGRVIVSWGLFENQLDFGLMSILELPEAISIKPALKSGEPIPRPFSQKIPLWKKVFRKVERLSPFTQGALDIATRAKELCTRRDAIVHGNWNNYRDDAQFEIIGVHFRLKGTKVYMTEHVANESGVNQIAESIRNLSSEMGKFLGAVHTVTAAK